MSEDQVSTGLKNYGGLINSVSNTQTVNPNLQTQVASRNAAMNAAPDPSKAQSYAQQLFDKYLQMMRGPGGGTGGASSPAGSPGGTPAVGIPGYNGQPVSADPTYPGTEIPGFPNLDTILGQPDAGYNGMDINSSSIDPFAGLA
jgi:hypothetical protein